MHLIVSKKDLANVRLLIMFSLYLNVLKRESY